MGDTAAVSAQVRCTLHLRLRPRLAMRQGTCAMQLSALRAPITVTNPASGHGLLKHLLQSASGRMPVSQVAHDRLTRAASVSCDVMSSVERSLRCLLVVGVTAWKLYPSAVLSEFHQRATALGRPQLAQLVLFG